MHPWVGAGPDDRRQILDELGLDSIDDLFATIPSSVCVDRIDLPPPQDEESVKTAMARMAISNLSLDCVPAFVGAGVYRHIQPSVVDAVLSRAEFFTSYTPYQPEISQGTLQVIFEFQTLISRLTGLRVANASLYDGATALVEAVLFSHRVLRGKRDVAVVAETVHPMYRRVLETYAEAAGIEVVDRAPGRRRPARPCPGPRNRRRSSLLRCAAITQFPRNRRRPARACRGGPRRRRSGRPDSDRGGFSRTPCRRWRFRVRCCLRRGAELRRGTRIRRTAPRILRLFREEYSADAGPAGRRNRRPGRRSGPSA